MSAAPVNSFIIIAEAMPTQANQPLADDYQLQKALLGERDPVVSLTSRNADFRELVLRLASWRTVR